MKETIKNFFTGGQKVEKARQVIRQFGDKPKLSPNNRERLRIAKVISRRHALKLGVGAVLSAAAAGAGVWKLVDTLSEPDLHAPAVTPTETQNQADKIRQQIREFEAKNVDKVTPETAKALYDRIVELYQLTFDRTPAETQFITLDFAQAQKQGLGKPADAPYGHAGIVQFGINAEGNIETALVKVGVYLGNPEKTDPSINKLSVIRGLIMHEFVHAQTNFIREQNPVMVGNEIINPIYRIGLKYVGDGIEYGWFFEEINTQLIAEYLNDPKGQDPLFNSIEASPLYRQSFNPLYFQGTRILSGIYQDLGITIKEVEDAHFRAAPKEMLEKIDQSIAQRGIDLPKPASAVFLKMTDQADEKSQVGYISELTELAQKIRTTK